MIYRLKPAIITIIIFSTIGTFSFYYFAKSADFMWSSNLLLVASQLLSLLGTVYLSITLLLSSRFPFLEKITGGLDVIYKLHHILGAISFMALLHHPLLLAVQKLPNTQLALKYLVPGASLAYNLGIFALMIMILLLIFTIFIRLPYNIWKNIHSFMGLVLLLGMLHVYLINSDVSNYLPLQLWIFFWMGIGLIGFVYKTFFYQKYRDCYNYIVDSVIDTGECIELRLNSGNNKKIEYKSGQFLFFSTENKFLGKESHPFTIASAPGSDQVVIFCKKNGDYTSKLGMLQEGEKVWLHGPYGTFFETIPMHKNLVGIAGGIGITPFLSLIHDKQQLNGKDFTLFHVVKNKSDSLLTDGSMPTLEPNIKTIVHESSFQGRFSADVLVKSLDNVKDVVFYLCGSISMMESLRSQLLRLGVKQSKIIFEDFSFGS